MTKRIAEDRMPDDFRRCRRSATLLGAVLSGLSLCVAGSALAKSSAASPGPVAFDIPAQSLATALEAFSKATGIQILYDSKLASGRRSIAVKGRVMPRAALDTLLSGTDIHTQYADAGDVILVSAEAPPVAMSVNGDDVPTTTGTVLDLGTLHLGEGMEIGGTADYHQYGDFIRAEVEEALRRDGGTRSGSYNVGLQLWLGAGGSIERSRIFRSTGDRRRDAAIIRTVQNLTISQPPPANMPEPVSIVVFTAPPK
ncbi:MAG TPA: secretin and TonB N-terminal domain-containing protein [Stellaceae bacterium]|nr:secretin and TonB N-terminal domain-containing protein [Stellaceae bacterium]